jgi:hypothetical protein
MASRAKLTATSRGFGAVSNPIQLLAFLGMIVEAVVGGLIFTLRSTSLEPWILGALVIAAITLPVMFGLLIYRLLTSHHLKLYAPRDFSTPAEFLRAIELSRDGAEQLNRLRAPANYRPWRVSGNATTDELELLAYRVNVWQPILDLMNAAEFLAIHSWFNERDDHSRALLAIDIAIARGYLTSGVFAFRSASLRKLGRVLEAQSSAKLALALDERNLDAHYNLAMILASSDRDTALKHARIVVEHDATTYRTRLGTSFPELCDATQIVNNPAGPVSDGDTVL